MSAPCPAKLTAQGGLQVGMGCAEPARDTRHSAVCVCGIESGRSARGRPRHPLVILPPQPEIPPPVLQAAGGRITRSAQSGASIKGGGVADRAPQAPRSSQPRGALRAGRNLPMHADTKPTPSHPRTYTTCLLVLTMICGLRPGPATAAAADPQAMSAPLQPSADEEQGPSRGSAVVADIKAYVTAPSRWSGLDWLSFGGALGAIALAHHYDSQVRTNFTHNSPYYLRANANSFDLQDAAPATAALLGTWGLALLSGGVSGRNESWAMLEAASFGVVTAYGLKFAVGRVGPNQTTDPNEWGRGGSSFPSLHATVAFAIGTVMAESGSDEYRWLRRLLGYGIGVFTSYQRIKHNQHWLSDTVAGAAIGVATARFAMNRRYARQEENEEDAYSDLAVVPMSGGLMLSYRKQF